MKKLILIAYLSLLTFAAQAQASNSWTQKNDLGWQAPNGPAPREGSVAFSIGTKGYLGTGENDYLVSDFWEYDPAVDAWAQKANFPASGRSFAVGFSIGNKGYVGTGIPSSGSGYKNDFWEYDPTANSWTQKANFGGAGRYGAVGFSIGSKGYIGTGSNGITYYNDFWEYDPSIDSWTQKANFGGTSRYGAAGFNIGSKGYIGTGKNGSTYYQDFWEFDPSINTWTQKANFGGVSRYFATGLSIGTKGYIGTGEYGLGYTKDFWEFDPVANTWVQKANLTGVARRRPAAFAIGGKGYLGTGNNGKDLTDFWEFDQLSNVWMARARLGGAPKYSANAFNIATKGYIVGGAVSGGSYNDLWEFDPATNLWTQKADFPGVDRQYATGFSVGTKGYFGTGLNLAAAGTYLKDFWEYDPSSNTWTQKADFGGTGRHSSVGFSIGSKGYIGIGWDGALKNDFWEYNPATNTWTQKANFGGTARSSATCFSISTKGYVGTGYSGVSNNDFWEYDQATNAWTQKANFGGGFRHHAVSFAINAKGYVGTGSDENDNYKKDFWEYNPVTNSWTQKADFGGNARSMATGFSIGTKGYIGTGFNGRNYQDFWEYTSTSTLPAITSFSPSSGPVGTSVTITGTNFTGATAVQFNSLNTTSFTVNSATEIIAIVPTGATTGTIKISTPEGTATSNSDFTVIVPPTITTSSVSPTNICQGNSISVAFTETGSYNVDNIFTAELSDASGSFISPQAIGTGTVSPLTATIPFNATAGNSYRIRVISSSPSVVGTDNGTNISILAAPAEPTVTNGFSCGPGTVTLAALGAPAGGFYRWYTVATGGTAISGANAATYTSPILTNNTIYYVTAVSSDGCESSRAPVTATINSIPNAPVASYNNPLAGGSNLQLFSTPISGATYSWTGPNGFTSNLQNPTISNASGLHAGTYSVTAIVNGCSSAVATVNVEMILSVSGVVRSEHNTPINTVSLTTTGGTIQSGTTNATGTYSFDFSNGGNYTIAAAKANDVVANNGVTTLDIALVRRHLLGGQPLGSPYKILAADVNASGGITTADIAQMRSLILTTITSFGGEQWKFVPGNYMFPNPVNPFPFTSAISTLSLTNLSSSQAVDFIGLKLGDVNNTWDNTITRLQAAGDLYLLLPARKVQPQDTVLVPVRVKDFTNVSGYQFTMEWDKQVLQFLGIVPATLQGAYGQHQVSNGKLTTTWDEPSGQSLSLADSTIIFQLKFKATGLVGSVSSINITSSLTKAESYNQQLAPLNLKSYSGQVQIGTVTAVSEGLNDGYALSQNYPNPFSTNTTFSFNLPKAEKVMLTIYNSLGQVVASHSAVYSGGEHQLELENIQKINLNSGAYFISFTAGEFTSIKKMIVLK